MFIAGQHTPNSQSPRGATCTICLNRGLKRIERGTRKILSESGGSGLKDGQD